MALTQEDVPAVCDNIIIQAEQPAVVTRDKTLHLDPAETAPDYTISMLQGNPKGTESGFVFSFVDPLGSETLAGGTLFLALYLADGACA